MEEGGSLLVRLQIQDPLAWEFAWSMGKYDRSIAAEFLRAGRPAWKNQDLLLIKST